MSGEQPFLQEAVEQLNRFQEEHDRGVKVTSVKVSASEKVSTGDYENYSPHSTMEADVFLAESWEEQREDLLETLLDMHRTNQRLLAQAVENRIALPEDEDWMLEDLLEDAEGA